MFEGVSAFNGSVDMTSLSPLPKCFRSLLLTVFEIEVFLELFGTKERKFGGKPKIGLDLIN